MNSSVPLVRFGEFLKINLRPYTLASDQDADLVGVKWYGEGPFHREFKPALNITKKSHFVIRTGDIIYNKLFAWKGSFGIVPPELDGMYVSDKFPTYSLNRTQVDENYLKWYFHYSPLWDQARDMSTGSAALSKFTLNPPKFLELTMPLPPLVEQQRIVAKLEQIMGKIGQIRQQHDETKNQSEALLLSALHKIFVKNSDGWNRIPFNETIAVTDKQVDPTLPEYSKLPHISGENIEKNTCRLLPYNTAIEDSVRSSNYLFSSGSVLYSKIRPYLRKAVYVDFQGVCSADIYPIRIIKDEIDPHFLKWTLVAEPFTEYANRLSGRTRMPKLNRKQLFNFMFSYPSFPEQCRIVAHLDRLQAKVDEVKRLQAETEREMVALVPAVLAKAFG